MDQCYKIMQDTTQTEDKETTKMRLRLTPRQRRMLPFSSSGGARAVYLASLSILSDMVGTTGRPIKKHVYFRNEKVNKDLQI